LCVTSVKDIRYIETTQAVQKYLGDAYRRTQHDGKVKTMKPVKTARLSTDKYINDGLRKGDIGNILEDCGNGCCEVEFCEINGITITFFSFPKSELELLEEDISQAVPANCFRAGQGTGSL